MSVRLSAIRGIGRFVPLDPPVADEPFFSRFSSAWPFRLNRQSFLTPLRLFLESLRE